MRSRTFIVALASGALAIVVAACGGAATPIPSAATASQAAASAAAPSTEASVAASEATSSEAAASGGAPSFALPSLPSQAKDLEAELPGTLCGATATKLSMNGASFLSGSGTEFAGALTALGKSPSDVSVAVAQAGDCGAIALRIAGIDQGTLQAAMLAAAQKAGCTAPSQSSVGGKSVYVATDTSGKKSYVYFKGDTMFIAEASSDTDAGAILQALP